MDGALTSSTSAVLTEDPESNAHVAALGKIVGVVGREGDDVVLRLRDAEGPVFARFRAPRLEVQPCWSSMWRPEWLPVVSAGTGAEVRASAQFVWWRFEAADGPAHLVRFGPEGVAWWRPAPDDDCYRSESLLGLIGGGLRAEDYLSPVAPTDGATPDESEETEGTKPLRIDMLPSRGLEQLTAREGIVELRTAKNRRIERWQTTLPRGSASCTRAAYHRFMTEPVQLFFEIEFSDDDACDEGWERHEVQQALFELREDGLVKVVSGSLSTHSDLEGTVATALRIDVRIPSGDGFLRYVGDGKSSQGDLGGDDDFDCGLWTIDQGYDAANTAFSRGKYSGVWTFETDRATTQIGAVEATAAAYRCGEAGGVVAEEPDHAPH